MKSWKTSLSGIAVLAGIAVSHFFPEHAGFVNKLMAAAVALGLISARDNKVTSEQANAKNR